MAGGKLTPRQKMINLMYLVFIAMLALNMSKEVLSAFGLFNEKFEKSNIAAVQTNQQILDALKQKATDDAANFAEPKKVADKVVALTKSFYDYVGSLKAGITEGVEVDEETGKLPYEAMDKADAIDYTWFKGDGYTDKGKEVLATINKYREDMKAAIGKDKKYSPIIADLESKFNTDDVKNKEGITVPFLDYHYRGFPGIASLTKLSAMQSDAKTAESNVLNALIGNTAIAQASMSKYKAIVVLDKNAFFQGETVTGRVVLGRYDDSTVPTKVVVNGNNVPIENGQAIIKFGAGSIGEQKINGEFTFMEDGKPVPIPIEGNYVVVPQPKEATISADKMNVVYRGVVNPMTISFAGVSDTDVTASGPGLSRASGTGKYNMSPGQGTEAVINVTAKLPGGKTASSKKVFRIKGIPAPVGTIGGEMYGAKGQKSRLAVSQIGAKLPDFDFDVNLTVTGFTFKAPGQAAVIVNGNRVNSQCEAAMARASRGDAVTITDIKVKLEGSNIMLPRTAPIVYEIQ
ncbi:gliding motility protein GldM [Flavobacterium azooxidireducens]|uniref:Gliding motility protein GldM n=1 Tax=Flavobacterium azooxidireducens TaxID=1871076 RepID=A0ABY4KH56_9FLAO|nr:gliding motility protein GldM [Flavobacterium azooxidireducens]UPQ79874.1 gliding motility protein GldM [Flavobacterium azooxidireducens]